jgi:hypothetical protein
MFSSLRFWTAHPPPDGNGAPTDAGTMLHKAFSIPPSRGPFGFFQSPLRRHPARAVGTITSADPLSAFAPFPASIRASRPAPGAPGRPTPGLVRLRPARPTVESDRWRRRKWTSD